MSETVDFTEEKINALRERLAGRISEFRFRHTLGVEREAVRLGELYAPEKIPLLRAAALLHDVTKENTFEKQLQLAQELGIMIGTAEKAAPKTLHAITGAAVIGRDYPEFADPELVGAIRWHTTGRENMNICEKLIYLADYIEENRKFEDCIILRRFFWDAQPQKMNSSDRIRHLSSTMVLSFDMTVKCLICEGAPIDENTVKARNYLIYEKTENDLKFIEVKREK